MSFGSVFFLLCCSFCSFVFLSCSVGKDVKFELLQGYLAYRQKDWDGANMHFLHAEEIADNNDERRALSYIYYAQSATLLMQNEIEVASEKLKMITLIDEGEDNHLISSLYYQMGLICFLKSDYKRASSYFKKSLEAEPFHIDAKINYELSIREIENERIETLRKSALNEKEGEEAYNTLLDVFRKREVEEWQRKREKQQEHVINDY